MSVIDFHFSDPRRYHYEHSFLAFMQKVLNVNDDDVFFLNEHFITRHHFFILEEQAS